MAPPAAIRRAAPDGCLRDLSASPRLGTHNPLARTTRNGSFPLPNDQPPLVGVQLVRPRRFAAAGAPAGPPPAQRHDPGQLRERSRISSHTQPGDTMKAIGLKPRALLTSVALMGAAGSVQAWV
jgi:hypothetical protein